MLSDDLQRWSRDQHDKEVPERCVHVFADRLAGLPRVRVFFNTKALTWELQSFRVYSSPENAPGLPQSSVLFHGTIHRGCMPLAILLDTRSLFCCRAHGLLVSQPAAPLTCQVEFSASLLTRAQSARVSQCAATRPTWMA